MKHYDAKTAKRHIGFANSAIIRRLDKGKLQVERGPKKSQVIQTCAKYQDRSGKLRYKGTSHLRDTQSPVYNG